MLEMGSTEFQQGQGGGPRDPPGWGISPGACRSLPWAVGEASPSGTPSNRQRSPHTLFSG